MADIVAFPNDVSASPDEDDDELAESKFLLNEGLELLADYRAIADVDVRASLRALVKSLARSGALLPSL